MENEKARTEPVEQGAFSEREGDARILGQYRIPTAAGAARRYVARMQRESTKPMFRSMEISQQLKELGLRQAEREAERHAAIVETPDELRRLNAKIDDLAIGQKRTDRRLIALGAVTAFLTLVVVVETLALLVDALSG